MREDSDSDASDNWERLATQEEERAVKPHRETVNRRKNEFVLPKPIQEWAEFKNTWKEVKFNYTLNKASPKELEDFWLRELTALCQ